MMKLKLFIQSLILVLCTCSWPVFGQSIDEKDFFGTWEIQGTLMGDDGKGWLLPHKNASPNCKDYTIFLSDHTGKEIKFQEGCEIGEQDFLWEINEDQLVLTRGERTIIFHIASLEEDVLTVGVQLRANSENRMYVKYKRIGGEPKTQNQ